MKLAWKKLPGISNYKISWVPSNGKNPDPLVREHKEPTEIGNLAQEIPFSMDDRVGRDFYVYRDRLNPSK